MSGDSLSGMIVKFRRTSKLVRVMGLPRRPVVFFAFALVAIDRPAMAQPMPNSPTIGDIAAFGSIRTRTYLWDWFGDSAEGKYSYPVVLVRLGLARTKRSYDWQVEFALPTLLNLPTDAVAPPPQGQLGLGAAYSAANGNATNAAALFPKQVFARFKNLGGVAGQALAIGRMEFNDGSEVVPRDSTLAALKRDRISQRLLGTFGFSDVGRSIDGAQYMLTNDATNVTVVGGRPTQGVFQVDGWGELSINLLYAALTRQTGSERAPAEFRIFGIAYDDYRRGAVKTDNRPTAARTADMESIVLGTFGAHYLRSVPTAAGPVDVLLWGAGQTGSWGRLTNLAGAIAAEAGWQPSALSTIHFWVRGGYDYASGDSDANDHRHGTFFQVLPTPRIYARFPFYNMMNTSDAFGEMIVRPGSRTTWRTDVHAVRLADTHDLWYSGGGAFQPQTFGYAGRPAAGQTGLAILSDASLDYAFSSHVALAGYGGYAHGGGVTQAIYSEKSGAVFGYAEMLVRF